MQAGWYPDPSEPNRLLRWWDGQQWTAHVHEVQATAAVPAATPPHAPRRRRLWPWLVAAGGLVVALVLTLAIVPGLVPGGSAGASLSRIDELPVVHTDESLGIDFTEPVLGLSDTDARLEMAFRADIADGDDQLGSLTSHKWAVRLFSDASLRSEITTAAIQTGDRVRINVYEEDHATWFDTTTDENPKLDLKKSNDDWGLHSDYYLVRYVDADGIEFERPVVTRFNFESEISAPAVSAGVDPESPGELALSWTPVEGADRYAIVYGRSPVALGGEFDDINQTLGLYYVYLGETSDTHWNIGESFTSQSGAFPENRNRGLERPERDEDSVLQYGDGEFVPTDLSGDEIGVVAISSDGATSPLGTVNASSAVGSLPSRIATYSYEAASEYSRVVAGAREIDAPKFVPYIDFTGRIQHSPVTLNEPRLVGETVHAMLVSENGFEIDYEKRIGPLSGAELSQMVDEFNRAAIDLAGNPGELQEVAIETIEAGTPQTEYEDTGLPTPTATSHPMVDYLAEHMLAGTIKIDVSEWANQPGAPDPRDAAREAAAQTPLAFVRHTSVTRNEVVQVTYSYPVSELRQKQQEVHESALVAIESMQLDGKSDAEKVTAFNDYLSDTVVYDYDAYAVYPDTSDHTDAYNLVGVLTAGTGVCAGYADAMNLFAQIAGVESVVVSGKVVEGGYHAWNKFKVDGQWLAVDATWNDGDVPNHEYLLITDAEFTGSAEREEIADRWIIPAYAQLYATP